MAVPFLKVYYTAPQGVEEEISNLLDLQQGRGLQIKNNKADIVLKNSQFRDKNDGESIFVEDGLVEIYADYSPITKATSQLLLSAQVREINPSVGEKGGQMKLTVADRTVLLLSSLQTAPFTSKTAPVMIQEIVAAASEDGDGNQNVTTNNVASTNKDGGAFPTISEYGRTFKPVIELITELSQPDYTGDDRPYYFFVDTDNDLHWFYPAQTSSGTIVQGTDVIYDMNFKRNADNVINMVIFNAGQDLNGNGVLWYYYDSTTKTNELRMKYFPMTDLSTGQDGLFDQEIAAGNLTESSTGETPYKGKLFVATTSGTTSWGATFSSRNEYNDSVRTRLKSLGQGRAQAITTAFGKLLWSGKITLKGTNNFTAGDLLTVTLPSMGLNSYLLRVHEVTHSFQKGGWMTVLELKEDEDAINASQIS